MDQNKNDIKLGRFISLVLRHEPAAAGIVLDENGWADVGELLEGVKKSGRHIDMATLERIVAENSKKRYAFNADRTKIRANQGHSIDVDVELMQKTPPEVLYHGTAERFLTSIMAEGLTKRGRQHVHLSADMETAVNVGKRHGKPVILQVNAAKMAADGHIFYLSENNVWLTDNIPPEYFTAAD